MPVEVDWNAIKVAIASNALGVSGLIHSSATGLDSAPVTPALLVTHIGELTVVERGLGYELQEAEINGVLVTSLAPGTGTAMDTNDELVDGLAQRYRTTMNLGYPGVVQDSWMKGATQDLIEVGSAKYAGYRIRWGVKARMNVTRSMS